MNKLDTILKKSSEIEEFKTFDVDQEWNKYALKFGLTGGLQNNDLEIEKQNIENASRHILYMLSFAATLILVFSCLFLFKSEETTQDTVLTTSETRSIYLSDRSIMDMGKNSSATYYVNVSHTGKRHIFLSGDASFDVKSNIMPFRVYHKNIIIEVLGTQFSIKQKDEHVEIINKKGSVKVLDKSDYQNFRILTAGDTLLFKNGIFVNLSETMQELSVEVQQPISQKGISQEDARTNSINTTSTIVYRKYTLESVVKNYLLKYNKKKLKIDKKNKPDLNHIVQIDNINKSYLSILEDLKRQGVIDFVQGDCPDCYIIQGPKK